VTGRAARLTVALWLSSGAALAEDTVPVQADVVFASTAPGVVEPTLAPMQAKLGARVKYQTLRRLSSRRLELRAATAARVELPNAKVAELSLVALKQHVAEVRVKVPPVDATYSLGKEKSLYVQAGPHQAGELWLVLSPPR
jgi:hypothetical protein